MTNKTIEIRAELDFPIGCMVKWKASIGTEYEIKGQIYAIEIRFNGEVFYRIEWADFSAGLYESFQLVNCEEDEHGTDG